MKFERRRVDLHGPCAATTRTNRDAEFNFELNTACDLCVSSLRRGQVNRLGVVAISTDASCFVGYSPVLWAEEIWCFLERVETPKPVLWAVQKLC